MGIRFQCIGSGSGTMGGSQAESHGHYIVQVTDGGFVQVGETGMLPNSAKIFVVKVDQNGALMWQKSLVVLDII